MTWCHNPVCTLTLCFMAKYYKHAYELIKVVGEMEVTMELMLELDTLIKYIESPVFGGESCVCILLLKMRYFPWAIDEIAHLMRFLLIMTKNSA